MDDNERVLSRTQSTSLFRGTANSVRPGHPNPSCVRPGFYEEYHPDLSHDTGFLEGFIAVQKWIFARTMPKCPHWYVVRGKGPIDGEFIKFVHHIRAFGYDEPWGRDIHRYLDFQGFRYWTMGFVMAVTIIINRCELGNRSPQPFSGNPQIFFAKPASPDTKLYSPN